jgi:hypothetical protein
MINENLTKLRALSKKLSSNDEKFNYDLILIDIENILSKIEIEILKSNTLKDKVKCYEKMCIDINNVIYKNKI